MTSLKRFWPAVESLPSLAAVETEWLALVGGEFLLIKPFLRPLKDRASSFPRSEGGLPYQIIEHDRDDFVGVCQETGDITTLTKSQLVVYELDRRRLGANLANACGIDPNNGPDDCDGKTVYLGQFTSDAKICYATFLAFPNESEDLYVLATRLIADKREPFIVFTPSRRWLRRAVEAAVRVHGSVFVSLADTMKARSPGQLEPVETLATILARETSKASVATSGTELGTGRNVFRLEGEVWTLTFAERTVRLKNSIGLNCIAHLISKKRCHIDAVVLKAIATKNIIVKPSAGIEALDLNAIEQYKREHEDLLDQLEEAKKFNDIGKQELIQSKIDTLVQHVNSATSLGGRIRKTKDHAANARTSLTNAIGRTIQRLQEIHADLARHFSNSIKTGQSMSYYPEADVDWDL